MINLPGNEDIQNLKEWTLFLDRDGVINKRLVDDYVKHPGEFEYLNNSPKYIAALSRLFKYTFVATNQQGVGKGLMTMDDVHKLHDLLQADVEQWGGAIDKVYVCPDLATDMSPFRKPQIGMAIKASNEFNGVDLNRALMVGDSLSDMEFGKNAGMQTVFIHPDPGYTHPMVDLVLPGLKELFLYIGEADQQTNNTNSRS